MWKLKLIAGGILLIAIVFGLWRLHDSIWDKGYEAGKIAQQAICTKECAKAQNITNEVSHAYQVKIADLNRQLESLRVRPPRCIAVTGEATSRHNATAGEDEHGGQNGVPAAALYQYAGEAERYRLQLIACQDFLSKTNTE